MNIINKYSRPGSPFRYLRKGLGILSNPLAHLARMRLGAEVLRGADAISQERVKNLEVAGYETAGDELDPALLAEVDRIGQERLQTPESGTALRSFFTDLTKPTDLLSDSLFVRFALQPSVLRVATAYFGGKVPYLSGVQLLLSHGSNNTTWAESQLWHRDYSDARILKLWVYLTDVTEKKNGPFTFLPAKASEQVKNDFLCPGRVSDEAMEENGLAAQAEEVFGPRLKAFYIDTARCYHLGSRLKLGENRLAYIAAFTTHAQLYPCENGISVTESASELEKVALSM